MPPRARRSPLRHKGRGRRARGWRRSQDSRPRAVPNRRRSSGDDFLSSNKSGRTAARLEDWNVSLADDLRDQKFAREFLLAAIDEGVPLQVARGKIARAMGVMEFAAKVRMASSNLLR